MLAGEQPQGLRAQREGVEVDLPLRAPGAGSNPQSAATTFAYIRGRARFVPSRCGVLSITAHEGRELTNKERLNKQDPFIELTLGGSVGGGGAVTSGGAQHTSAHAACPSLPHSRNAGPTNRGRAASVHAPPSRCHRSPLSYATSVSNGQRT